MGVTLQWYKIPIDLFPDKYVCVYGVVSTLIGNSFHPVTMETSVIYPLRAFLVSQALPRGVTAGTDWGSTVHSWQTGWALRVLCPWVSTSMSTGALAGSPEGSE